MVEFLTRGGETNQHLILGLIGEMKCSLRFEGLQRGVVEAMVVHWEKWCCESRASLLSNRGPHSAWLEFT
jgi:hypothetical protein